MKSISTSSMIFLAEIGKKTYLLSASSIAKANEVLCFYHKDKEIKIQVSSLPDSLRFRMGFSSICTTTKVKDSVVYFTTESGMSGKVDISLLPIEPAQALP